MARLAIVVLGTGCEALLLLSSSRTDKAQVVVVLLGDTSILYHPIHGPLFIGANEKPLR
jgi:hypothetical protein